MSRAKRAMSRALPQLFRFTNDIISGTSLINTCTHTISSSSSSSSRSSSSSSGAASTLASPFWLWPRSQSKKVWPHLTSLTCTYWARQSGAKLGNHYFVKTVLNRIRILLEFCLNLYQVKVVLPPVLVVVRCPVSKKEVKSKNKKYKKQIKNTSNNKKRHLHAFVTKSANL